MVSLWDTAQDMDASQLRRHLAVMPDDSCTVSSDELDASGAVVASWPVSGDGREEIIALAATPGGFLADIAHTAAARVGDVALPAPHDPLSGAAVVVRAAR